jgi:uncharacterized protein (TIGR02453 family)
MSQAPAYPGFPVQGLRFLEELAHNNERAWFQAHKDDYTEYVLQPAQDLAFALGERLKGISEGIAYDLSANGSGSILRIYRDLRFSKDKRPYNTRVRLVFWEGQRKKMENPGFFVGIDPGGVGLFAGMHVFPKPFLNAYRDAIVDETLGEELEAVLASVRSSGAYEIGGEHYKRVPRGYDAAHPRAGLLRHNGLYAHARAIGPETIPTPELVEACYAHLRNMAPLQQWLVKVGQLFEV